MTTEKPSPSHSPIKMQSVLPLDVNEFFKNEEENDFTMQEEVYTPAEPVNSNVVKIPYKLKNRAGRHVKGQLSYDPVLDSCNYSSDSIDKLTNGLKPEVL